MDTSKFHGKNMVVLYPNQCFTKVCYKPGTAHAFISTYLIFILVVNAIQVLISDIWTGVWCYPMTVPRSDQLQALTGS